MPAPGEVRTAVFKVHLVDFAWDWFYAPVAKGVRVVADRLNIFQYLTIRRYLMLTFFALISLRIVVALWH
jgi:hydrogenase-4 component B